MRALQLNTVESKKKSKVVSLRAVPNPESVIDNEDEEAVLLAESLISDPEGKGKDKGKGDKGKDGADSAGSQIVQQAAGGGENPEEDVDANQAERLALLGIERQGATD